MSTSPLRRMALLLGALLVAAMSANGCFLEFVYPPLDDAGADAGPDDPCPPLRELDVVQVGTASELAQAVAALRSNQLIELRAGTYRLESTEPLQPPVGLSDVAVVGATGRRQDVVIDGRGQAEGFEFEALVDVTMQHLTISNTRGSAFVVHHDVERAHFCDLHLVNAGQDYIVAEDDGEATTGSVDGVVERSLFERTTPVDTKGVSGITLRRASGWTIRDNRFDGFVSTSTNASPSAIQARDGSRDTIVERNLVLDCDRGIMFGVHEEPTPEHTGGIIRNNVIHRVTPTGVPDVGIYIASTTGAKILHNTVILSGTYPSAIEYRFASSTDNEIARNLTDAAIKQRDGARAEVTDNIDSAEQIWFVNPSLRDFHLTDQATAAIDQVTTHPQVADDIDRESRPRGALADIGADEK